MARARINSSPLAPNRHRETTDGQDLRGTVLGVAFLTGASEVLAKLPPPLHSARDRIESPIP